jgi:hypothetical protein
MSPTVAYVGLFLQLSKVTRELGYALAIHGSSARDLDVIAVPWSSNAVTAEKLVAEILANSGGFLAPYEAHEMPRLRPHGRMCWFIHLGGGAYIDLSVLPIQAAA